MPRAYNKQNDVVKSKKDESFFTNSLNVSYDSGTLMYITVDNNTKYITLANVLNILKGENTPAKQILVNRLSDYFYNSNGIYSSMIEKSVGIMCFDRIITRGKSKKAKDFYISLLRSISEKYVGKTALRSCLKYGAYYGYLSYLEKNDNADGTEEMIEDKELKLVQFSDASIIPLNPKYIKVLSTDGKTHRIGIDLAQLTIQDIQGFPREIYNTIKAAKSHYDDEFKRKKKANIKVIRKQYYILDESKTIVIRLRANADESCGRAAFVTAITQLVYDNDLLLRKEKVTGSAGKTFIYETFPEGQKGKGTSALTTKQMEDQHAEITKTLKGFSTSEIGFCSIQPNTKIDNIDMSAVLSNLNSDDIIKRIGTHSGFSTGLLNGMDIKNDKVMPILYEMLAAEFDDFTIQWEKELNKVASSLIKSTDNIMDNPYIYYLPTNRLNRSDYTEVYRKAFSDAGGSYQLYLASTGIPAEIQLNLMAEEEDLGFREKYPAHPMASTTSSKESKTSGNNEDSSIETNDDGVNEPKKIDTKKEMKSKSKTKIEKKGGK